MFRVIVAYLLCTSLSYVSALSSERNLMRSEGRKGKQAARVRDEDDDGDDREDAAEHDDEPDDEKDASLMELGAEGEADEEQGHKDGSEYEEGELEDEGEEGDDSEKEGEDEGEKGHENEREEDDEHGEEDDAMWAEDVHYIAGAVLQEFEDIQREGRNVTAEHITQILSEEHLKTLSENESMFGLKLVGLPENAHTMGFDEFVEHASPAKFIDLVLKSKENYTGTDTDPGVLTLAQFQARDKERERGEHEDAEREDIHFLPESTYKNLESLSSSQTNISKEKLEEILSDERLEKLPDSEAIVQVRIENCPDPLPELLNQLEPAAFLDKVVKGKAAAAASDSKNMTLGELRKFQAEDEQSIAQEGEQGDDDEEGDQHDDDEPESKVGDGKKSKDDSAHNDEKDQHSDEKDKQAAEIEKVDTKNDAEADGNKPPEKSDEQTKDDAEGDGNKASEKSDDNIKDDAEGKGSKATEKADDANPDSVTS